MEEHLKKEWRETSFNYKKDTGRMQEIMDGRKRTALENLARRYRTFSTLGFVMVALSLSWNFSNYFGKYTLIVSVAMTAYFLICGIIDYQLLKGIESIDIAVMPVAEVSSKALYYRKKHLQSMAILTPLAICLIGLFVYASTGDIYFFGGVCTGAVVGLGIGLMQLRRFMLDYRRLSE